MDDGILTKYIGDIIKACGDTCEIAEILVCANKLGFDEGYEEGYNDGREEF